MLLLLYTVILCFGSRSAQNIGGKKAVATMRRWLDYRDCVMCAWKCNSVCFFPSMWISTVNRLWHVQNAFALVKKTALVTHVSHRTHFEHSLTFLLSNLCSASFYFGDLSPSRTHLLLLLLLKLRVHRTKCAHLISYHIHCTWMMSTYRQFVCRCQSWRKDKSHTGSSQTRNRFHS